MKKVLLSILLLPTFCFAGLIGDTVTLTYDFFGATTADRRLGVSA